MSNLNDPVKLPINWAKILTYSSWGVVAAFLLGMLFRIRALILIADIGLAIVALGLLAALFTAIVRKFSKPQK